MMKKLTMFLAGLSMGFIFSLATHATANINGGIFNPSPQTALSGKMECQESKMLGGVTKKCIVDKDR